MKMPFLSVASRVSEALQDEVLYKFCSSVLVNILQASVGTVIERDTYASYRVHTCYSLLCPFLCCSATVYKTVFMWLLMKTSGLRFENVQSTYGELLVDKTFFFAF